MPVLVACGGRDAFGPGGRTVERAAAVFPDCTTALDQEANHLPKDKGWGWLVHEWMVQRGWLAPAPVPAVPADSSSQLIRGGTA